MTYLVPATRGEEVLLMTCRVKVIAPDGTVTQARALLDSAASTSLISERLAKQLRLARRSCNFKINGVAGINVHPNGLVKFKVAGVRGRERPMEVEASVLPKVTADLPTSPVTPVTKWKHLSGLEFADPDYGTPARVDLLLGGKVFSKVVLHGRWLGPTGAPSAFKTRFGWVLNGQAKGNGERSTTHVCCATIGSNTPSGMPKCSTDSQIKQTMVNRSGYSGAKWKIKRKRKTVRFGPAGCWHQDQGLEYFH